MRWLRSAKKSQDTLGPLCRPWGHERQWAQLPPSLSVIATTRKASPGLSQGPMVTISHPSSLPAGPCQGWGWDFRAVPRQGLAPGLELWWAKPLRPADPPHVGSEVSKTDLVGSDAAGRRHRTTWAHSQHRDQPRQAGSSRQESPGLNNGQISGFLL